MITFQDNKKYSRTGRKLRPVQCLKALLNETEILAKITEV